MRSDSSSSAIELSTNSKYFLRRTSCSSNKMQVAHPRKANDNQI